MITLKAAWSLDEVGNASIDAFGQWKGYHENGSMHVDDDYYRCYIVLDCVAIARVVIVPLTII